LIPAFVLIGSLFVFGSQNSARLLSDFYLIWLNMRASQKEGFARISITSYIIINKFK
jgi:hypothetical protein